LFSKKLSFLILVTLSIPGLFFTQLACNPSGTGLGTVADNTSTGASSTVSGTSSSGGSVNQAAPNMPSGVASPSSDPTIKMWPQLICQDSSQSSFTIQNPLGAEDEQTNVKYKTHFWGQLGHMKSLTEWMECDEEICGNRLIRIVNWDTNQYIQVKPQFINGKHSTFEVNLISDETHPKVTFYALKDNPESTYTPSDTPQNCSNWQCANEDWKILEAGINNSCSFLDIISPAPMKIIKL